MEFAMLAGLLFSVILATVQFGLWSANQTILTGSARDSAIEFLMTKSASAAVAKAKLTGSRLVPPLASGTSDLTGEVKVFVSDTVSGLDGANAISAADLSLAVCKPGQAVKVSITYPRSLFDGNNLFFSGFLIPKMVAESVAICE